MESVFDKLHEEQPIWNSDGFNGPWIAPAKLNLMLRILGQRPDGYHELQTVFQFINIWDYLYFRPREDGKILRINGPGSIPEAQDITVRAAKALQSYTGCSFGVEIRLDKRLPIGGGLGGGSSDAATTLLALNKLWNLGVSKTDLKQIGLKLGADIPVFIGGVAAWGEGVGEQLTALTLPEPWYLLIAPNCQVATGQIFSDSELTRNSHPITIANFLADPKLRINDCLAVVKQRYQPVAQALDWLQCRIEASTGKSAARLTGTGACVFAEFASEAAARLNLINVPMSMPVFVVKGMNNSPLELQLI